MPEFIPMSREKAIDGIMIAFAEASNNHPEVPAHEMHHAAESALVALGVTEQELEQWGARVVATVLRRFYI